MISGVDTRWDINTAVYLLSTGKSSESPRKNQTTRDKATAIHSPWITRSSCRNTSQTTSLRVKQYISRSAWPHPQPAFDESALNAFLKSRKAVTPQASAQLKPNLFRPAPEELGKWGNPGLLRKSDPNARPPPPTFQAAPKEHQTFSIPSPSPAPPNY